MLKQIIVLIALSIAITVTMSYAQYGIQFLLTAHEWVSQILTEVFSVGPAGNLARGLLAVLAIPVFIASVPTAVYWAVRRSFFPYFLEIVWIVWLVQAGALLVAGAGAVAS